ncbi:MAG: hypothetical protein A2X49_16975 [Lentisphaerae bacterium GWF2_52_8]|nr:MAG: hypothetical protein A2X49_16975 [Lentisphaerae bacterium GWF2_52_8]
MSKRVLIAEDDDEIRELLIDALSGAGYEAVGAKDGFEALREATQKSCDLMVVDIIMPDKEGIETIMEFRKKFPQTLIIAISGGGRIGPRGYLETAKQLGASRTFAKPFSIPDFIAAVKEMIG